MTGEKDTARAAAMGDGRERTKTAPPGVPARPWAGGAALFKLGKDINNGSMC